MSAGAPGSNPSSGPRRPPEGRTVALAAIVPPDDSGRKAFLISCGAMIVLFGVAAVGCAFFTASASFLSQPVIAGVSAFNAVVLAIPYFFVILWLDRNEKEPIHLIISAFLWGAIMATMISCVVNTLFGAVAQGVLGDEAVSGQLTASISAPFIEELTKGAALLVIFLFFRKEFDNVMDGIVYGAIVGLGFAAFENFMYYTGQGSVGEVFLLTYMRGIVGSIGSHACYTAITGVGFGLFRVMRKGALRWLMPPMMLGLAMFVHFAWNTFVGLFITEGAGAGRVFLVDLPLAVIVLQMPFVFFVVVVSIISLRHERKLIEKYLKTEKPPVLQADELARLVPARRRSWHSFKLLITFQLGKLWRTRKRNAMLIRLAFEKWHMDQEASANQQVAGHYHAERVLALRQELINYQVD